MRVFDFNSAIVRKPGSSVVNGLRSTAGPSPVFETILDEHRAYVSALQSAGVHVTELAALENFPDSIFVEDPALVFTAAAILLRPGAPSRNAEAAALAPALAARFPRVLELAYGCADGGDVLVTPDKVLIGLSARTDRVGAAALRAVLASIGLASEVVPVPATVLHLKSAAALIDEETVLATAELAACGLFAGYRVLVVPDEERAAANALRVNDTVLVRAGCPRTQEMLVRHGSRVSPLSVTEIAKIDAGLSCMSLRWYDRVPAPAGVAEPPGS
jgi:dimethylargininase